MKKIVMFVLVLVFVSTLFAHEAYLEMPIIGYAGSTDEGGGFVQGYVGLGWWGADYGFHANVFVDQYGNGAFINLAHVFKKFTLHEKVELLVGKTAVPFVKQLNPSGFANINIIEGNVWNFVNPENQYMIKFGGDVSGLGWQIYTADINASDNFEYYYADYGLRLDYNVAGADIGAGLQMVGVPEDADAMMDWAFDLGYTAAEMVNIKLQVVNNDDAIDDTSDLNLYTIVEYVPGLPFWIMPKPYFGYYTYDGVDDDGWLQGMENNAILFGLNLNPTEDSVLKIEYKMYSEEILILQADGSEEDYMADTLTLQLGFKF